MLARGSRCTMKVTGLRRWCVGVPVILTVSMLLGCGGGQGDGGAGASDAKPSSPDVPAAKAKAPVLREPLKSLSELKGMRPPPARNGRCGQFKVPTTEAQFADGKPQAVKEMRKALRTAADAEARRYLSRQLYDAERTLGLAAASCPSGSDSGGVLITHAVSPKAAQELVQQPYTSLYDDQYDEPRKKWEKLPAPASLGESAHCYTRSDTRTLEDFQFTTLREVCLIAVGSYAILLNGEDHGDASRERRSPKILQQAVATKAWFEAGAK